MSSMSFQEKSAWGTLVSLLVIGLLYGSSVVNLWRADQLHLPATLGLAIGFTVLLVALLVGYHILMAIFSRDRSEDERDKLIGWRAGHIGGLVLGLGVVSLVLHILVAGSLGVEFWRSPVVIANGLLLAIFLSTVVELASTLWFHRRGI